MKKHYRKENDCLNCGTILEGKFCHNCGQENLQMKESFGHMINHAVSDYFHFDDQFFHTIKPLLFKPGKLTNEYMAGHRAQYLHPVKMYIFISLIFFVIFFQKKNDEVVTVKDSKQTEQKKADEAKKATHGGISFNKGLTADQQKVLAGKVPAFVPDTIAKQIKADIKKDAVKNQLKTVAKNGDEFVVFGDDSKVKSYSEYLMAQQKLPEAKRDGMLLRFFAKKNFDWKNHGKDAREIFTESIKHNAPKMMFLFLPLFALILKLAFWKNHKFYVEHIINCIHLHCFVFLFLTVTTLLEILLPNGWEGFKSTVNVLVALIINWYFYRAFRVVYNRSRWRTISKMIGVSVMYTLVFTLCFFIMVVVIGITAV